jgi:chromosome segregation ATPase
MIKKTLYYSLISYLFLCLHGNVIASQEMLSMIQGNIQLLQASAQKIEDEVKRVRDNRAKINKEIDQAKAKLQAVEEDLKKAENEIVATEQAIRKAIQAAGTRRILKNLPQQFEWRYNVVKAIRKAERENQPLAPVLQSQRDFYEKLKSTFNSKDDPNDDIQSITNLINALNGKSSSGPTQKGALNN